MKQPLALTPRHNPTESLLGYALRVSERNGYDTPWHIMTHAGLSQGKMGTAGFSFEKLAAIFMQDASELEVISYCKGLDDGSVEFKLLGHSLGQSLKFRPLRLTRPQFCPHCVQEKGFLDVFWDLTLVVACPKHKCSLVDACPDCGEKLKWFRPAILTCKCGANLANVKMEKVSDALASMMGIILTKIHSKSSESIDNSCGFPIHELENLPLRSLLVLLDTLGRHNLLSQGQISDNPKSIVQSAIEVLQNWPHGYYEFLRRTGNRNDQSQKSAIGLRKSFEKLYHSLFKRRISLNGIGFMRQEFIRFGLEEWGERLVDNKLLRGEQIYKRFVSLSEQAARMGVRPITVKQWCEKGILQKNTVHIGSQKRYIIDSNAVKIKKSEGRSLNDRAAGAFIGLPVSVLKSLKRSGHYEVRHVTSHLKSFHENDLNAFSRLLCSLGEVVAATPPDCMSLGDVMRLKFRNDEGKADFLRNVITKKIEVIGRTGNSPVHILFHKNGVTQFLRDKRAEAENGTWALNEVAKHLHCDPSVLPTIIKEGLLESIEVSTGMRVTEKSIKDFEAKFVSVAKLAKKMGTSSTLLQKEIAKKSIPLKLFERGYGKVAQPFLSLEYDDLLSAILENLKVGSARSQYRPTSAILMRLYLEGLKERGVFLPRQFGKPNKSEIAKACGFDRNILYRNSNVTALLDAFDMEERQCNFGVSRGT